MILQKEKVFNQLLEFVSENFMLDIHPGKIDLDASLVLSGMIDSTGFMELIVFMEKKWKMKIPPEEMTQANLGSLRKIAGYISKKTKN